MAGGSWRVVHGGRAAEPQLARARRERADFRRGGAAGRVEAERAGRHAEAGARVRVDGPGLDHAQLAVAQIKRAL